jgi:predicted phage tail protein
VKTVRLYGALGDKFGRVWRLDVKSPGEAIRALCSQLPGFRRHLQETATQGYRVLAGRDGRNEITLCLPSSATTFRVVPVVSGAGKGLGGIIVGAALIWASSGTYGWGEAMGATMASAVSSIGFSMVIGGVSQAMTKTPKTSNESVERPDNKPSYAFDGAVNTAAQGNPVPVCYGELLVGSQVISAGLTTEQVAA